MDPQLRTIKGKVVTREYLSSFETPETRDYEETPYRSTDIDDEIAEFEERPGLSIHVVRRINLVGGVGRLREKDVIALDNGTEEVVVFTSGRGPMMKIVTVRRDSGEKLSKRAYFPEFKARNTVGLNQIDVDIFQQGLRKGFDFYNARLKEVGR